MGAGRKPNHLTMVPARGFCGIAIIISRNLRVMERQRRRVRSVRWTPMTMKIGSSVRVDVHTEDSCLSAPGGVLHAVAVSQPLLVRWAVLAEGEEFRNEGENVEGCQLLAHVRSM